MVALWRAVEDQNPQPHKMRAAQQDRS